MRQSYRILPVYTGDVSGVCSALYELHGMVVMHDPSGCNSTYNTHDEIRWYDQDSLIFLSGLTHADAVMGSDDKLIGDIVTAARTYSPCFIAVCNSPIPYLSGQDFEGICRVIEQETGIPTFYAASNGMFDYVRGAGLALEALARKMFDALPDEEAGREPGTVNILGMTPLDFAADTCAASVRRYAERAGWKVRSVWAMGDTLEDLKEAPGAELSLVVSSTGFLTAEYLHERFGIPWAAGVPVGPFAPVLAAGMRKAQRTGECSAVYLDDALCPEEDRSRAPEEGGSAHAPRMTAAIGEAVLCGSIAAAARLCGEQAEAVVTAGTHIPGEIGPLLGEGAGSLRCCLGEEEIEAVLAEYEAKCRTQGKRLRIAADPMYEMAAPEGTQIIRIPQLAFSGRVYRKEFPDLMDGETWRRLWD